MITLEQVQLLETKVTRAIEYVQRLSAENTTLLSERDGLQKKLEMNQKRIDELEVLVMRFKEDQGRIEDGIIAALDRLSQFEEAFENSLKDTATEKKPASAAKQREKPVLQEKPASNREIFFEIPEKETVNEELRHDEHRNEEQPEDDDGLSSEGELDIF